MKRWYHKMMHPLDYLHLQMRLEGIEIVHESLIRQVEVVPGEEMPLMLIAQLADGSLMAYYKVAISQDLHKELVACIHDIQFPNLDVVLNILRRHGIEFEAGHYKTYLFPSMPSITLDVLCLSKNDPRVKEFGFDSFAEYVYALERSGNLVSACVSTRENETCGEAWVFTASEYRHQGLAHNVVSAWAGSLLSAGKVPFYTHKIDNFASANLARSLKLQPVFEEISITQV
jgi:GNAT acetyltransferase